MTSLFRLTVLLSVLMVSTTALAQQTTFYLDRLQVAGAPGDGIGVWRPQTTDTTRMYGQLGFGYSLNPFRVENYIDKIDQSGIVEKQNGHPVSSQVTTYAGIGVSFLGHFTAQASFPLAVYQGNNPTSSMDAQIDEDVRGPLLPPSPWVPVSVSGCPPATNPPSAATRPFQEL